MFDVDSDGNLLYVPGADEAPADSDGSLFDIPEATEAPPPQEDLPPAPDDVPLDGEADDPEGLMPSPSPVPDGSFTGSGNSAVLPVSGLSVSGEDVTLTTSGDVYIYPDGPEEEVLAEARSAYSATVTGLPNTASLAYLEDVAEGYPSWYHYLCFKTDANYSQSMALWIGPSAEKNPAQNRIDFSGGVDCIEVNYVRSGSSSSYYYEYKMTHYDSYQIPYSSNVFLYTDVVDGFGRLDLRDPLPVSGILFLVVALAILLVVFRGGDKS